MVEPVYLFGTGGTSFKDDVELFHYTKFDSLLKILDSMTLRSSPLCRMNDLNEASVCELDWGGEADKAIEVETHIQNECSIICFAKNYSVDSNWEKGSNHPAMWAHYADDSNGACIVLDQKALLEINKGKLRDVFYKLASVKYDRCCAPHFEVVNTQDCVSVSAFVRKYYQELFFKKHIDWSYETEERFFAESPKVELDIKGAIKYIVLGGRLKKNNPRLRELVNLLITPGTNSYRYLTPFSFAQMSTSIGGYLTEPAAPLFIGLIKEISQESSLAEDYFASLKK